jgi:anhydro-N-acetylmuramic acid kinase
VPTLDEVRAKPERIVAGLMTGTSLDGLDLVLCRVAKDAPWRFELLAAASEPYPAELRRSAMAGTALDVLAAARLSRKLGRWYAEACAALVARERTPCDLVGLHGQTVAHEHGLVTVQLGEPGWLAARLGCPVVADFRQQDIVAGGCGAPLVSIVDLWLYSRPDAGTIALNLGGIANLTAVPPTGEPALAPLGLDCGPANMVLDELARRCTGGRLDHDHDGALARRGRVRADLLAELLADPALAQPPPRSLGREQFGAPFVDRLLQRAAPAGEADWHDLFATASAFTVEAVALAIEHFVPRPERYDRLVVGGGGTRNPVLMDGLAQRLSGLAVVPSDRLGLPAGLKEPVAFALLAAARIDRIPGNVPAVTGAARPTLLGRIIEA